MSSFHRDVPVVSVQDVVDLMWGYLFVDKNMSQRSLALKLSERIRKQGSRVSVETIQRAFGSGQEYVQAIIKEALLDEYRDSGFKTPLQIKKYVNKHKEQALHDHKLLNSSKVNELIKIWMLKSEVKSKRDLAKGLRKKLAEKGYDYHLGSLQNIFSNKIKETKQVVYDTLREFLIEEFYKSETVFDKELAGINDEVVEGYQVMSTGLLKKACREFLQDNSVWTKRKLAIQLAEDLTSQGFKISYNSLQYALAGKRDSVKKIVYHKMLDYIENPPRDKSKTIVRRVTGKANENSKLKIIHERLKKSKDQKVKKNLEQSYKTARASELKKLWERRRRAI